VKVLASFMLFAMMVSLGVTAETPIRFDDIAADAGVADVGLNGAGVAFSDYDNDGDIDI
jgi:hypothetical protein